MKYLAQPDFSISSPTLSMEYASNVNTLFALQELWQKHNVQSGFGISTIGLDHLRPPQASLIDIWSKLMSIRQGKKSRRIAPTSVR